VLKPAVILWLLLLCAVHPAGAEEKTVVVLGDSIAAGYGVDPDEAFPALLQEKIRAAGLSYRVVNAGVSGDTTAGGARRISWVLRNPVDVLLLELGGNDGLRGISPAETAKNLQQIVDKVRSRNPDALVVIAGMQMANNMGDAYNEEYREVFPAIAKKNDAALVPFLLEGVGGKPELNQPDRIHPTPEGHRIVAENVWKVMRPLLEGEAGKKLQAVRGR
jgi:acyl-CoA thioesterase I